MPYIRDTGVNVRGRVIAVQPDRSRVKRSGLRDSDQDIPPDLERDTLFMPKINTVLFQPIAHVHAAVVPYMNQ